MSDQFDAEGWMRQQAWMTVFLKAVVLANHNRVEVPIAVMEEIAKMNVELYFDKDGDKAFATLIRPNNQEH